MTTRIFAANNGNFFAGWDKLGYSLSPTGASTYSNVSITASNPATRIVGTGPAGGSFGLAAKRRRDTPNAWPSLAIQPERELRLPFCIDGHPYRGSPVRHASADR